MLGLCEVLFPIKAALLFFLRGRVNEPEGPAREGTPIEENQALLILVDLLDVPFLRGAGQPSELGWIRYIQIC